MTGPVAELKRRTRLKIAVLGREGSSPSGATTLTCTGHSNLHYDIAMTTKTQKAAMKRIPSVSLPRSSGSISHGKPARPRRRLSLGY